ncbi:MAG: hypothetical protein N3D15_06080 [Syntrophorhabdaceae bacterium]|nr:hypothetical protein [Syntrophorhabdaceae bacterium]
MLPKTIEELESIKKDCRRMATKRSMVSAFASTVPIPFADVATDIILIQKIIPTISERFGLSKDQIDNYDSQTSVIIYETIKKAGESMVGKYITKELITQILKKIGVRITIKQAAKYVPVAGQVISAGISFGAMKLIINKHINDCYKVARELIDKRSLYPSSNNPFQKS